jgi:hypothetical protein
VIDPLRRQKIADIPLKAHSESFQLEALGARIFVNVPDANEIAVLDLSTERQTASWSTQHLRVNFPLAIDKAHQQVLTMFRHPATLAAFSICDGSLTNTVDQDVARYRQARARLRNVLKRVAMIRAIALRH